MLERVALLVKMVPEARAVFSVPHCLIPATQQLAGKILGTVTHCLVQNTSVS